MLSEKDKRFARINLRIAIARGDRARIAAYLRWNPDPIPWDIRQALADWVENPGGHVRDAALAEQRYQFLAVAVAYWQANGFPKRESAIAEVMWRYGMSRRTVQTALSKYGEAARTARIHIEGATK